MEEGVSAVAGEANPKSITLKLAEPTKNGLNGSSTCPSDGTVMTVVIKRMRCHRRWHPRSEIGINLGQRLFRICDRGGDDDGKKNRTKYHRFSNHNSPFK